ncbi:MAG: amylo-alpha-1,6-glucosidase [Chloroflexota bacterium]
MTTDQDRSVSDEWLVTNGLGGYAFGTVSGIPARTYHGLLVTACRPPVERTVLVAGLLERASRPGAAAGDLSDHLVDVRLEGRHPVFTYGLGPARLEKRVWMGHGTNTTFVRYALPDGAGPIDLELTPLLTCRQHHAADHGGADVVGSGVRVFVDGREVALAAARGIRMHLAEEAARGQGDVAEAVALEPLRIRLEPARSACLVFTTEASGPPDAGMALADARRRDTDLLALAGLPAEPAVPTLAARLILAADAFLVRRDIPAVADGRSVIAGYPWFNDWGRDTMIALPGLCLATGRHTEAATILRSFAAFVRDGLIPNDFPDDAGVTPAYHTIDASLWYIAAIAATIHASGDGALLHDLLPSVRQVLDRHIAGTRFGIGMDPADGLLRGGEDGVQLTWMDAKVDGWVVTPRRGKPVEIQALWVNALRHGAAWTGDGRYATAADRAETSFRARFWLPERGYLADVVDGPDGDEWALRPNQLLALSLPHPLVDAPVARSVLAAIKRELAVPLGLRSLARSDPAYRSAYQGDRWFRDAGYHQGTVWTWLIGPYADAISRFGGGPAAALEVLRPFAAHLDTAGLGSISEILEPEPPFTPRGCPFQAWGVAEVLRTWRANGGT